MSGIYRRLQTLRNHIPEPMLPDVTPDDPIDPDDDDIIVPDDMPIDPTDEGGEG